MRLRGKLLAEVTGEDVDSLIQDGIAESNALEYKSALPGEDQKSREAFLATITSFANTDGGIVIYGIAEGTDLEGQNTGIPVEVSGVGATNHDQWRLQVDNMLRDAVQPPLTGCTHRAVSATGANVFAIGVPASPRRPHGVGSKGRFAFYKRGAAGKYPADIGEIRRMFIEAESWAEEATAFRMQRVHAETEAQLLLKPEPPFVVTHVVPLGRLRNSVPLTSQHADAFLAGFALAGENSLRHNLDGVLLHSPPAWNYRSYAQLFRFGGVEILDSDIVEDHEPRAIHLDVVSGAVWSRTFKAPRWLHDNLDVAPPYAIFATLVGVEGRPAVSAAVQRPLASPRTFLPDIVAVPPQILEEVPESPEVLRPLLDALWQSAGFPAALGR